MEAIKTLLGNPTVAVLLAALVAAIVIVLLVAIHQGREISFWPPKISARPANGVDKSRPEVPGLEGEWFEEIPMSPERRYSIGVFRFDKGTRMYSYDGTNYRSDGKPFCTWRSKAVIVDLKGREVQYIFDASICDERHESNTGFGVINLVVDRDGKLTSESGYYIEARKNGKPLSHTMRLLDDVAKELGLARRGKDDDEYYQRVIQSYEQRRIG